MWPLNSKCFCTIKPKTTDTTSLLLMKSIVKNLLQVIALHRYIAVVHATRSSSIVTRTTVRAAIAVTWLFGLCLEVPYYIATSFIDVNGVCQPLSVFPNAAMKEAYGVFNFCQKWFIPLCVFTFCNVSITRALRRRTQVGTRISSSSQTSQNVFDQASRRMFRVIVGIVTAHVICWSTNQFIFLAFNFGYPLDFSGALYYFSVAAVSINSSLNPIIYLVTYTEFRRELFKLMGCSKLRVFSCAGGDNSTKRY